MGVLTDYKHRRKNVKGRCLIFHEVRPKEKASILPYVPTIQSLKQYHNLTLVFLIVEYHQNAAPQFVSFVEGESRKLSG